MKLSIITVNYNNSDGLQRTINSVIEQTWHDFEWIIIDGGSADGSKELIEQNKDSFSYWCSESDNGIYHAMNKGISQANGDYLLFLNSGDSLFDKDVLHKFSQLNLDADIIAGQVVRGDNGKLIRIYDDDVFIQIFKGTLNHQGSFIRKSLFDNNRYDENLKVVSDWKFWIESIVWNNASVCYTDLVVAIQDMTGISHTVPNDERERVLDTFFPPRLQKELNDYVRLRSSVYVVRSNYLLVHSPICYRIGRRFLALLMKMARYIGK